MKKFKDLFKIAAKRKGGEAALEKLLSKPKSKAQLSKIADDRWLSGMSKRVFSAGFNWSVIDNKWPGFEKAFDKFDPNRCAMMSDDDLDRHLKNTEIVRHAGKIQSIQKNAQFCLDLREEHGSVGEFFGGYPATDFVGLIDLLKKRGHRLGGTSAQYFLREMGVDSVIFTDHVSKALIREGVVDKKPTSKGDMKACQNAFNAWMEESGRPLNHISRVLAFTVDE